LEKQHRNYKYTLEEAKQIFVERDYIPLFDSYSSNKDKLLCANNLGYKALMKVNHLLSGQGTAWFHPANPYTIDNIKQFLLNNDSDLELLSQEFVRKDHPLKIKCGQCNNELEILWDSLRNQKSKCCWDCARKARSLLQKHSLEHVQQYFISMGYTPLFDSYEGVEQKLTVLDSEGFKGELSYHNLSSGSGFYRFHPANPHTYDNIKLFIIKNDLTCQYISGEYKDKYSILCFQCECGDCFYTTFNTLVYQQKNKCAKCSNAISKIELKTIEWLDKNGYKYTSEQRFPECKNILTLSFDFCVSVGVDIILIECQGAQHYKPIELWGGQEVFNRQVINDNIKREFCKTNNIKLVEIPYTAYQNDTYKEILRKELSP